MKGTQRCTFCWRSHERALVSNMQGDSLCERGEGGMDPICYYGGYFIFEAGLINIAGSDESMIDNIMNCRSYAQSVIERCGLLSL